jgi:SAM-dependent methyltransferase
MTNRLDAHVAAYQGSNLYDFDNQILLNWYPRRLKALFPEARTILELGIGHGFTTPFLSESYPRHVVLEGSPAVIANFKETHPAGNAEVVQTFFETYDTGEQFDLIVMGFVLEHVDDPLFLLQRYRKFLAPGGKLFIAVPNAEVLNRRLGHLAGMLPAIDTLSENDRLLGHKRYFTRKSLEELAEKGGFRVELMEGIYLKPFTTAQILSLKLDQRVLTALCEVGKDYPELCCGLLAQLAVS